MRFFGFMAALVATFAALPAAAQQQTLPSNHKEEAPDVTDKSNLWLIDLSTGGRVTILLRPDVAPKMVERIKTLTRRHFYDGTIFHRVTDRPLPIAQGGDPTGTGQGNSDLPNVPAEFNYLPHARGAVAAARTEDENSANSQFYIMFRPALSLDKRYTVFGRVIKGMEYVDMIHRGEPPKDPSRILHAYIASDNPPPYQAALAQPAGANPLGDGSDLTLPPKQAKAAPATPAASADPSN